MPAPFEMVSGPIQIWTAPETTVAPELSVDPPAVWKLLGTNGQRSMSEDGVTIEFSETIEAQTLARVDRNSKTVSH